jgi:2-polyprenyl-6-methoxyphenol hydroxylase-like FAD-dependent oxidoreductase
MNWHAETNFAVTIAGGSIGGLCAGVALRGIGADVHIYERVAGPMETRGAGIVVQGDLVHLLRQHHAPDLPMTACRVRRYLDPEGGAGTTQAMPQQFTSWEAIYKTLRATFPDDRYHMGAAVSDVMQQGSQVTATLDGKRTVTSDLFLAADGSNSALRHRFVPDAAPNYAGYVAWRGTLDESDTPPHLVAFFDDAFTFSEARSGGHILVYFIPGDGQDVHPGHRRLNWVWYVCADEAELVRALVDKDGKHHHASLPQGVVATNVVADLRSRAQREVHPKLAELVSATRDPFMQTIVDVTVPGTVFGRVMLIGDAAFVVRPHTAGAAAKAAYDATVLSKSLARARQNVDAGLRAAESLQMERGQSLVQYGVALGNRWAKAR